MYLQKSGNKYQCEKCGIEFEHKWRNGATRKYCSRKCNGQARFEKSHVVKKCKECGKDFKSWAFKMRSYCSHLCANKVVQRKKSEKATRPVICKTCKKTFIKRTSDLKIYKGYRGGKRSQYCSRECWKLKIQNISSLKQRAWVVFSAYIRNRDKWTCFTCDKREQGANMHAGHFISRSHNSTLFDEMNVHAQCASCNMFRNGQPHLYAEKLIQIHGQEKFMQLVARGKEIKQFTKQELREIYDRYKSLIKINPLGPATAPKVIHRQDLNEADRLVQ